MLSSSDACQLVKNVSLCFQVEKLQNDVSLMHNADIVNMRSVREKVRYLKNSVQSCKTIPKDFASKFQLQERYEKATVIDQ